MKVIPTPTQYRHYYSNELQVFRRLRYNGIEYYLGRDNQPFKKDFTSLAWFDSKRTNESFLLRGSALGKWWAEDIASNGHKEGTFIFNPYLDKADHVVYRHFTPNEIGEIGEDQKPDFEIPFPYPLVLKFYYHSAKGLETYCEKHVPQSHWDEEKKCTVFGELIMGKVTAMLVSVIK